MFWFSLITLGHIQQESCGKKYWSVLLNPLYLPDLVPSDFHLFLSLQNSEWENIFSSRSVKNFCGKLLELKTSWILLEGNQQATKINGKRWFKIIAKILLIEINSLLNYSWINYILLKWKLSMSQPNNNNHLFEYIYMVSSNTNNFPIWSIWWIDGTLTGTTILGQSEPESNGNERIFHTSQISRTTPLDTV